MSDSSDIKLRTLAVCILAALLTSLCVAGLATWYIDHSNEDSDAQQMNEIQVEHLIHEEVNERRAEHGLDPLNFDDDLRPVSREYSEKMAKEEFFSHDDPTNGDSFEDRYEGYGYECEVQKNETHVLTGGENLARSYYNQPVNTTNGEQVEYETLDALAEGVVDGWMNSQKHRENILKPSWENQAIGVYVTNEDAVFVTQNFC